MVEVDPPDLEASQLVGSQVEQRCARRAAKAAAAVAVEKVGTAAVGTSELREQLPENLAVYEEEQ